MATVAELAAEISVDGVPESERDLDRFGKKVDETAQKQQDSTKKSADHDAALRRVGTGALVAGGALLAGFGLGAHAAEQLDTALAPVGTLLGANSKQAADLRDRMTELIANSPQSADDIGMSAYTILSAGISGTKNVMDTLRASQKLSEAGLGSMGEATDLVTSSINAFKGENLDADQAARILFGTITLGKTTTADLAQGFGEIAPLAAAAGVSFHDLLAATAALTATGQSASVAYTGIRGAITNIIKPTADAADTAKQLGLDFSAAHLKNVGLPAFLDEVKSATGGNVDTMAKLFGSVEGVNAVLALTGPQAETFTRNLQQIDGAGKGLNDRAGEMEHTVGNMLSTLENKASVAVAKGLKPMMPVLEEGIDLVGGFADAWAEVPEPIQGAVGGLGLIAGVGLTAVGVIGKFGPVLKDGMELMRGWGTAGGFVADNLGRIAAAGGTAILVASTFDDIGKSSEGTAVGVGALTLAGAQLGSVLPGVGTAAGAAGGFLVGFAKDAFTAETASQEAAGAIQNLSSAVGNLKGEDAAKKFLNLVYGATAGVGTFRAVDAEVRFLGDNLERLAAKNPGQAKQIADGFASVRNEAGKLQYAGDALEYLTSAVEKGAGKYRAHAQAARDDADVNAAVATGTTDIATALTGTADAFDQANTAAKAYKTTIDNVLGVGIDVETANIRWHDSLAALTKAFTDNGATLDINTEQGRKNRQQMADSTQAALAYAEAQFRQSGSIDQANGIIGLQINALEDAATQAGLSGDAALAYIEDILNIPASARTDIHNTADIARYAMSLVNGEYDKADGRNVSTNVDANTDAANAKLDALNERISAMNRNAAVGLGEFVEGTYAQGGIIEPAPGGRLVRVAEAGAREIILPTDDSARAEQLLRAGGLGGLLGSSYAASVAAAGGGGGGGNVTIVQHIGGSVVRERDLVTSMHEGLLRRGRDVGGLRFP